MHIAVMEHEGDYCRTSVSIAAARYKLLFIVTLLSWWTDIKLD